MDFLKLGTLMQDKSCNVRSHSDCESEHLIVGRVGKGLEIELRKPSKSGELLLHQLSSPEGAVSRG